MKKYKFGDCLSMIKNGAIIKQAKGAKGYPITRIETLSNNFFNRDRLGYADIFDITPYKDYILESGDLIMSHINSRQFLGRTVLYNKLKDEIIIHGMNVLRIKTCPELLDPIYAYYLFKTEYFRKNIDNIRKDAINQSSISISDINNIILELPVISLQKSTASILSSIDRKIELNRSINHNLEAMAKQLYDYWFLQFNFPDENGKPYKSSGGKMVWNKKLKREIPEGWEVDIIQNIATTYSGGTPKSANKEYYKNGTIAWINSGELNSSIITQALNYITERGLNNSSAKLYPANTVLVAMYGATTGKVSLLTFEACSNQAVCGVIPNMKEMQHYVYLYLSSLYSHFINLSIGSARDNISQEIIKNMLLPIPSTDVILMFENKVKHVYKVIIEKKKQINTLTKLRDSLLPLLMNGQASLQNCD